MPFGLGIWEILILAGVLVLLFGAKGAPAMARRLGTGVREMKDAVWELDPRSLLDPKDEPTPEPKRRDRRHRSRPPMRLPRPAGGSRRSLATPDGRAPGLMDVASLRALEPFTTKDGSTIREYLHSPAQSLAEATLEPGQSTQRHYHALERGDLPPRRGWRRRWRSTARRARSRKATRS